MDDLLVHGLHLPIRVGQILRADEYAVECVGAPVLAMTDRAIFQEQTVGIHLVCRITCLLKSQRTG